MNTTPSSIAVTIPAEAQYIDIVRLALYGIAEKAGFSFEQLEDLKVAVTEACTNAVLHAYGSGQPGVIDVRIDLDNQGIRICIKDDGNSFNYDHTVQQFVSHHLKSLNDVKAGGLGLFLMHALMDNVEVRTDRGTEVILTKRIGRKEEMA
ncbi:anti-sigma B factor RsbW [Paenibacillus harenae]|uniref:Serine/threonine-protein kinase RsbW n=1 Tax=Paenibacillus harenae TaxID=306543 RepID=A0ABT9TXL6_PAEHA|nr:anti-sigma B factor RsbW [Paenibacillus harenae]MDQ0112099.1 serine/threonine-protein kinase RsbW [Paenibacillus harenae]